MNIQISAIQDDIKALDICKTIEKILYAAIITKEFQYSLSIRPDLMIINIDIEPFKINDENTLKGDMTIIRHGMKEELSDSESIDAAIHNSIEIFIENWLKFRIKDLKADYRIVDGERVFQIEIPRGFNDPKKYIDSLNGWGQDFLIWGVNYDVTDELHKVGGLKNEDKIRD